MKYFLPLLLVLLLLFGIGYFHYRALEQRYIELQDSYAQIVREHAYQVGELRKEIAALQETIQEREKDVKAKEKRIAELDKRLTVLETQEPTEAVQEQAEGVQEQLEIWKQKFSLCSQIVGDKDSIIFSLTQQYEKQVQITSATEELLTQTQLRLIGAERKLKKKDRTTKLLIGAAIITAVILILKGVAK